MADRIERDGEQHVPFENEAAFIPDAEDIARREEAEKQRHQEDDHQLLIRIQHMFTTVAVARTASGNSLIFRSGGSSRKSPPFLS